MNSLMLARLLEVAPLPFVGITRELVSSVNRSDYVGVVWTGDVDRHYVLFGKRNFVPFMFDSADLQARNTCGVYCIYFSLAIASSAKEAEKDFGALLHSSSSLIERRDNDRLVIESVQSWFSDLFD
jgi:hypothetical protein